MKLQFEANQDYQLAAVAAVVDLFAGQPDASQNVISWAEGKTPYSSLRIDIKGVANNRVIDDKRLLESLHKVQGKNGIAHSPQLEKIYSEDSQEDKKERIGFPNFTVEMETGTGKTYVYLRTIYELSKQYGFKKFVIVVPSIAIREGVLTNLRVTEEHFAMLYANEPVNVIAYDSKKIHALRNFATASAIQILVINIDAFAKDVLPQEKSAKGAKSRKSTGNVINQFRDGGRPIEFIQNCCPIVILDEPQNMETDNRKQAIARLNPLCTLRYSATHRNSYNLLYSLDPVRAYELGLVKQISVDSTIEPGSFNQAFIEIKEFTKGKRSLSAKLCIWVSQKQGPVKKIVTVKPGDDLFAAKFSNGREQYKDGFIVNELDAGEGYIRFSNNVRVNLGCPHGILTDAVFKMQIEAAVRRHFEKAKRLHALGIKVLSVFFIDRVEHYRIYEKNGGTSKGQFALWFEEIYQKVQQEEVFRDVLQHEAGAVHGGYFSMDKQSVSPFETRQGKTQIEAESSSFELIMRDKERLLSLDEPLSFIFSHSALREGWDNPNVFQICTLAESASVLKKRQEIGRGLRLAVNQDGVRVRDKSINLLTVIANESYDEFASALQTEMTDAGVRFKKEMVGNGGEKVSVRLKKGYQVDPLFMELWKKISARTRYEVNYSTEELIDKAALRINSSMPEIKLPQLVLTGADIAITEKGVAATQNRYRVREISANYVMPDFIRQLQDKTGLSASALSQILLKSKRLAEALNNPQLFIDYCAQSINVIKADFLVFGDGEQGSGVQYLKIGEGTEEAFYAMRLFENDYLGGVFKSNVQAVDKQEKTLFSHIVIDSGSAPERAFAKSCEDNEDILFYIKLPSWFKIATPVGSYNPDWALIWRGDERLYFVAETKHTGADLVDPGRLRPLEQLHIECGKRHFKQFDAVAFKVVNKLEQLQH